MMNQNVEQLKQWIAEIALLVDQNEDFSLQSSIYFLEVPELVMHLIELIDDLDEKKIDDNRSYYSACVFAFDLCVAQLQAAIESGNKLANKTLKQLMVGLARTIKSFRHTLSFWLPILNAFYDVHVELLPELKDAYFDLASEENEPTSEEEVAHLNSMRHLIHELSDLSIFDITENFFVQSYAMPSDFFSDLVIDLYRIEEGQDIALLMLLHPKQEVRDVVVATHEQIIECVTLSSVSLSRLQVIKNWYPVNYHEQFNHWIKKQRKKGVVFHGDLPMATFKIKASEVDGSGAQGLYIHIKNKRKNRLVGLLLKYGIGIKDAWVTSVISSGDIKSYYHEAFGDGVVLREVDVSYLLMMINHFLALTIEQGAVPDLHFLEIQEALGLHWIPCKLDIPYLMEQLSIQINPFTPEAMQLSFQRSKTWSKHKRYTESWYLENDQIDRLVNQYCNFIDGVKVCDFVGAIQRVFADEMEIDRERWLFHFLWVALWLKAHAKKHEKAWQDSFFIAYAICQGVALNEIPIMHEICYQSVLNSVETMHERRTHLSRQ